MLDALANRDGWIQPISGWCRKFDLIVSCDGDAKVVSPRGTLSDGAWVELSALDRQLIAHAVAPIFAQFEAQERQRRLDELRQAVGPEAAFLQAMRDNPDDNVPRLVFADWLDERGQHERARALRDSCK